MVIRVPDLVPFEKTAIDIVGKNKSIIGVDFVEEVLLISKSKKYLVDYI